MLSVEFKNLGELRAALAHLKAVPDGAGLKFTKRGEVHSLHADTAPAEPAATPAA